LPRLGSTAHRLDSGYEQRLCAPNCAQNTAGNMSQEVIVTRAMLAGDESFIYSTWLRGLYYGNSFYGAIEKQIFFKSYSPVVAKLLNLATVRVACLETDPDVILGYAIISGSTLHWCFVKQAWRRQGIAKQLLAGSEIAAVSHLTKPGDAIRKSKQWLFNPFL
jgi:GNAT superfamily N-acetyltransferase